MQVRMFVVSGILDGSGYVVWRNQKSGTQVTPVFGMHMWWLPPCEELWHTQSPPPLSFVVNATGQGQVAPGVQSRAISSANFWYSKLSNCGMNLECYGRGHIIRLPT